MLHPYGTAKSELIPYAAGGFATFRNLVPARGPQNGKNYLRGAWIHFVGTCTVATAVINGADRPRILGLVEVQKKSGVLRYNAYADQIYAKLFDLIGPDKVIQYGDVAVGAAQTLDCCMYIPFSKPFEHEPDAYAIAADELKHIRLTMPAAADLQLNGNTVSVISGNYYVIPDFWESGSVIATLDDQVLTANFDSLTQCRISTSGKVRDLMIHKRGQNGGASLVNMTQVRIDALQMPLLNRSPDLVQVYTQRRGNSPGLAATQGAEVKWDIVRQARAIAVMLCDGEESAVDGKTLDEIVVNTDGNTVTTTDLVCIFRQVLPQTDNYTANLTARHGLDPSGWSAKTRDRNKTDLGKWNPGERRFLAKRNPIRGYQRGL